MSLTTLVCFLTIGQGTYMADQSWSTIFTPPLALKNQTRETKTEYDPIQLAAWMHRWEDQGLAVGYPDGMIKNRGEHYHNRFEDAVVVHTAFANALGILQDASSDKLSKATALSEIDRIKQAIAMVAPEITKLGADPKEMVQMLNETAQRFEGQEFVNISSLVSFAVLLGQGKGAPPDVPENHWAYPAVNEMFQNRLLVGYPSEKQLSLTLNVKFDQAWLLGMKQAWKLQGFLVGYPDGLGHLPEPSRYELAVMTHATWSNVTTMGYAKASGESDQQFAYRINSIQDSFEIYPDIARAISMLNPELTKLGADTKAMIAKMNSFRNAARPLTKAVKRDSSITYDRSKIVKWGKEWRDLGLALGVPDFHRHEPTQYEFAVITYQAWYYGAKVPLENPDHRSSLQDSTTQSLGKAINMFWKELTEIGANPDEMIALLNVAAARNNVRFAGNRRL